MRLDSTSMTTVDVVKTALNANAKTSSGESLANTMLRGSEAADNNAVRALDANGKLDATLDSLYGKEAKASLSDKAAFAKEAAASLDGDAASRIAQSLDKVAPGDVRNFAGAMATHASPAARNGYLNRELGEVKPGQKDFPVSAARLAGAADVLAAQSGERFTAALDRLLPDAKTLAPFNGLLESNPKAAVEIGKKIEALPAGPLKDKAKAAVQYNDADRIGLPPAGVPQGKKTEEARSLQDALVKLGMMQASDLPSKPGPSNFGPLTTTALTKFQALAGLDKTGQFDAKTREAMGSILSLNTKMDGSAPPALVNTVQSALVKTGKLDPKFANGNGVFGAKTDAALKEFQQSVGLKPNGIVGPTTFKALFDPAPKNSKSQLPTTVAEANKFFMNQFNNPDYNKGKYGPGEIAYYPENSCGPTSVAMALAAVGVRTLRDNAIDIKDVRAKMGLPKAYTGYTNHDHFKTAALAAGATAERRTAGGQAANSWAQLDKDLASGKAVVLNGYVSLNYVKVYGDTNFASGGNYARIPPNGAHIIAVIGKQGNDYLVADPLSRVGVKAMSQADLGKFFGKAGIPLSGTAIGNPTITPLKSPNIAGVSQKGVDLIYNFEAQAGVSNRLHWPQGNSGVTLGPGYDMGARTAETVSRDLVAVGIAPDVAAQVAEAAGLRGNAAAQFVRDNRGLVNLTPDQEKQLLGQVLPTYVANVKSQLKVPVTQAQMDALVSFAYNPGGSLDEIIDLVNAGKIEDAAAFMNTVVFSGQTKMPGLVNRRAREASLLLNSQY